MSNITNITISNLVSSKVLETFELSWNYTEVGTDTYDVYRFISDSFETDPTIIERDPINNTTDFELIASNITDKFYDDDLNGISTEIKNDIFKTKRQIYYKVIAHDTGSIGFNSLPYTFVGHNDGIIKAYSNIKQVLSNTLYDENSEVFTLSAVSYIPDAYDYIRALAYDPDTESLWFIANANDEGTNGNSYVVRVNVNDAHAGIYSNATTWAFSNSLYTIRIDPDTNEAYVGGRNTKLIKCNLDGSQIAATGDSPYSLGSSSFGNYAITLSKDGDDLIAHSIWDKHYVVRYNLSEGSAGVKLSTLYYGGTATRDYLTDYYNPQGINTGPDDVVKVNAYQQVYWEFHWNNQVEEDSGCASDQCPSYKDWCHDQISDADGDWGSLRSSSQFQSRCCCVTNPGGCIGDFTAKVCASGRSSQTSTYRLVNNEEVDYYDIFKDQMFIWNVSDNSQSVERSPVITECDGSRLIWPCEYDGTWTDYTAAYVESPPTYSTDGLVASLPYSGGLFSSDAYFIWQADKIEDKVHKLDNSTGTVSQSAVTNPMDMSVDSQNNVIAISEDSDHIKLYQLDSGSTFPAGVDSVYPPELDSTDYLYGTHGSDKYVEYVLTRAAGVYSTAITNITNASTDPEKRTIAYEAYESNNDAAGTKIYPKASGPDGTSTITRYGADSWHPNSDETGMSFIYNTGTGSSVAAYVYPAYVYPNSALQGTPINSTPSLTDGQFWDAQGTTENGSVSGYDDLQVSFSISNSSHSFDVYRWFFNYDDKDNDIGMAGTYIDAGSNILEWNENPNDKPTYIYHDPSQSGKPGERRNGTPGETNGYYSPSSISVSNPNVYLISGSAGLYNEPFTPVPGLNINYGAPLSGTDTIDVTVWERWPTTEDWGAPYDTVEIARSDWFGSTKWNINSNESVGDNGLDILDNNRIISGYDPLSAIFTDQTIARTWPVTAWYFDFGDKQPYPPVALTSFVEALTTNKYNGLTSYILLCADDSFHPRDAQTTHEDFVHHVYFTPGTYYTTVYTEASTTGTKSAEITSGITDQATLAEFTTLTKLLTAEILVLESCPQANFLVASGKTVPFNYSDSNDSTFYTPVCDVYVKDSFISGYAPNVTLTFMESSVARSYPISSYEWDTGDWYNETVKTSAVSASVSIGEYPFWSNDVVNHMFEHQYVMPGVYTATLNVAASTTSTESCQITSKTIYVEEINPSACFAVSPSSSTGYSSSISVDNNSTVYFNTSCILPGSFPICKIDYDFGDGSQIETVTRWPSADSLNTSITAYPNDITDPRNVITSHTYVRTLASSPSSYTPTISAYACNTNTHDVYVGSEVVVVGLTSEDDLEGYKPKHIIESRMYQSDDLLIVFENETGKKIMPYTLKGDN